MKLNASDPRLKALMSQMDPKMAAVLPLVLDMAGSMAGEADIELARIKTMVTNVAIKLEEMDRKLDELLGK
jgi:hypothetical protein